MKKHNYKKILAFASALTLIAGAGMTGITASAETDIDTIKTAVNAGVGTEAEEYVASLTDGEEQSIALMLLNDDVALEDIELAIQIYDEGVATTNSTVSAGTDFYDSDSIAKTKHYLITIAPRPDLGLEGDLVYTLKSTYIDISSSSAAGLFSAFNNSSSYNVLRQNSGTIKLGITCDPVTSSNGEPMAVARDYLVPTSKCTSEALLYSAVTKKSEDFDISMAYEIYAVADVQRDGVIDASDSVLILQYLNGSTDLNLIYNDGYTHNSGILNLLAADVNHDGSVTSADSTLINKYLVGSATIN